MKARHLVIYLVLVLTACGLSQAATKVLEWKFDGNLSDNSGNGLTGSAYVNTGAASLSYGTGVSGQAIVSDGNQCVYKTGIDPNILPVLAADTWSVNVWVYPTITPQNWRLAWCMGTKPGGDTGYNSRTIYSPTSATIVFTDGKGSNYLSTGVLWDVNQWQMITTTYDGTKVRVYKNGLLIGIKAFTFSNAPGEVRIPSNPWNGYNFMVGKFDEFTVWRGTLAQQEIIDLIIPGILPEYQAVEEKVYYTMDDPNGSSMTIPDHSGNSNTGLIDGYTTPIGNWMAAGKKAASLLFDGAQSVDLPTFVSISQNVQHSVAFWFKSGYQPFDSAFYSEVSDTSPGSRLIIRGDAGTDGTIKAYSNDMYYNLQYSLTYDASEYMNNTFWHHFALTCDGEQAKMYIDGEVKATTDVLALGSKMADMRSSIGYCWDPTAANWLGDWEKTYVDDFHLFRGALTQEDIQALMAEGNLDNDLDVDFADLAGIADKWLDNSTSVAGTTLLVDNMEGSLANWSVVTGGSYTGTGTITSSTNAYAGTKSLQWDYNLPALSGGNYSGIKYDFGTNKDLTSYDAMKLQLYRHAGNTPEAADGLMYIQFYDATPTLKAELFISGPNSVVTPVDEWDLWYTNLNVQLHLGTGYVDKSVLNSIRYIVIGCGSSRIDARTGIIDIDEVMFVKNPVCSPYLDADIDSNECKDCKVDFRDFTAFAKDWMLGTD